MIRVVSHPVSFSFVSLSLYLSSF